MVVHRFQTPDGKIHRVEAPDRASAETELNRALGSQRALEVERSRYQKPTPGFGRLDANATPLLQGATLNFADELLPRVMQADTAVRNLGRRFTGQPMPYTAQQTYDAGVQAFRENEEKARRDSPGGSTALNLGGAFMSPYAKASGAFVAGGKTLRGMMGRSAAVGAGYGGVAGAGGATGDERGQGAVTGLAVGGTVGALLPPALAGAQRVVAPIVQRGQRLAGPALKTPPAQRPSSAEIRAAKAVERAVKRDQRAGVQPRKGSIPFHTHGENVSGIAEVLAQSPGSASAAIKRVAGDSRAAERTRMKTAIAEGMGGRGDYFESLDTLFKTRADEAKTGMAKLGEHLVTLDENSVSALRSDLSRQAIKDAAANALASPDAEVRAAGASLNRLHDQLLDNPQAITIRVRDAQDISKSLLDAADAAYSSGNGARGAALKALGRDVRSNAGTPERGGFEDYAAWLKKYGDDSENIKALEMGRGVLTNSLDNSPEKLRKTLEDMSDPAKENFRKGVGEALLTQVRQKGIGPARQLLKDEDFAAKVRLAYPTDEGFNAFMAIADDAVQNEARNAQMLGNSRTYGRQAAADDLNAEGFDPAEMAIDAATLNVGGLARGGARAALKSLPRRDRSLVGDPKTNALLGDAVTDQDKMTALLNLLERDRHRALQALKPGGYLAAPAAQLPNNSR